MREVSTRIPVLRVLVLCLVLLAQVLFGAAVPVQARTAGIQAVSTQAEAAAARLDALGLFTGTSRGYDLQRSGTRAEGAVMLVRLLGRSQEASQTKPAHPFADVPGWASPSVGLLWKLGYANGVSPSSFDAAGALTGRQYCTFLLRALGQGDQTGSTYATAVERMLSLGLLYVSEPVFLDPDTPILRADMVLLSERALSALTGQGKHTLLDTLVLSRQVQPEPAGRWLAARLLPRILGGRDRMTLSEYDRSKAIHDWLVIQNRYGWLDPALDPSRSLSAKGYAALSLGTGVCGAYAEAMQFLGEEAGLVCRVINGQANGTGSWTGHAWNQIRIDGDWYHVDVTFDDPVGVEVLRYNYFHVTDTDIAMDHVWDRAAWPPCTATAANWFVRNGLTVTSFAEFKQSVMALVDRRGTEITLRATPFAEDVYSRSAIKEVLTQRNVVAGYTHSLDTTMGVIRITDVRYFEAAGG